MNFQNIQADRFQQRKLTFQWDRSLSSTGPSTSLGGRCKQGLLRFNLVGPSHLHFDLLRALFLCAELAEGICLSSVSLLTVPVPDCRGRGGARTLHQKTTRTRKNLACRSRSRKCYTDLNPQQQPQKSMVLVGILQTCRHMIPADKYLNSIFHISRIKLAWDKWRGRHVHSPDRWDSQWPIERERHTSWLVKIRISVSV